MRRVLKQIECKAPELPELAILQGCWGLFDLMGIAEEEIAQCVADLEQRAVQHGSGRYVVLHERAEQVKRDAFRLLCPTEQLRGKDPRVYRSHARELVERVATQGDTTQPTEAELLCAISEMSYHAPLTAQWGAVVEHLFPRVMGQHIEGEVVREPWSGSTAEVMSKLARRLVQPERKL